MSLILTLSLTNTTRAHIHKGSKGLYYCIEDDNASEDDKLFPIYYDIHFPLQWTLEEKTTYIYYDNEKILFTTGPLHCNNCKLYGYYNGVFIGYCINCAEEFEYKRGNGMTDLVGLELNEDMVAFDLTNIVKENSMWNTYLKNVNLDDIGDEKLQEEYELYKDLPDLIDIKEEQEEEEQEEEQEQEEKNNYDIQFPSEEEQYEDEEDEEDEEDKEERKYKLFKDKFMEKYDYDSFDEY